MYLNIVNNSFFENRRNKKKDILTLKDEEKRADEFFPLNSENFDDKTYFSLFFGDLTVNWLAIKKNKA